MAAKVTVPSGPSGERPSDPEDGDVYYDTTINTLMVYNDGGWNSAVPDDVAVLEELVLQDKATGVEVVISVRDGSTCRHGSVQRISSRD